MAVCGFKLTFAEEASLRSAMSRPAETEAKMTGARPGMHTLALRCMGKCLGPGRAGAILKAHKAENTPQISQCTKSKSNYGTKCRPNDRQRGQWNKRQRPETDPQRYDYLIKRERIGNATPGARPAGPKTGQTSLIP